MNKYVWIFFTTMLLLCSGCAWFETRDNLPVQELAANGMDDFANGEYRDAIESFEKIRDWYPFSKYAVLAELKTADAYYHLKEYEDAVAGYEEFENLHPRNEAVPYVVFQIGRCHFERIVSIDRDQSFTRKSVETFTRLIQRFPNDPYSTRATELLKVCHKQLCGHDLYVGKFYFKSKHYKAALQRFQDVLTLYPDVGSHQEALRYIAECEDCLATDDPTAK